jgi:hypothetical protein
MNSQNNQDVIAKPLVSNKYWILESNGKKVGTIQAIEAGGFSLVKNQERKRYSTINVLGEENSIIFDNKKIKKPSSTNSLIGKFPISGKAYNIIWNVRHKFAAYTKTKNSKCHYCAGYFLVKIQNTWSVMFCPKLILINRYQFKGPFTSKSEAEKLQNEC